MKLNTSKGANVNYLAEIVHVDKFSTHPNTSIGDAVDNDHNLVDLSKVWHDASEEPTTESTRILATDEKGFIDVFSLEKGKFKIPNGCIPWSSIVVCFNLTKWAYVSDLLPKGGKI